MWSGGDKKDVVKGFERKEYCMHVEYSNKQKERAILSALRQINVFGVSFAVDCLINFVVAGAFWTWHAQSRKVDADSEEKGSMCWKFSISWDPASAASRYT